MPIEPRVFSDAVNGERRFRTTPAVFLDEAGFYAEEFGDLFGRENFRDVCGYGHDDSRRISTG